MNLRNLAIWGLIILAVFAVFSVMTSGSRDGGSGKVTYSQLLDRIDSGEVRSAVVHGQLIEARDRQGHLLTATGPLDTTELQKALEAHGADLDFEQPGAG